ncbi:hypothetical protein HU200_043505 [Digitaria exilis]|uniref:Uncharacterized protein n=1 Tax=Digitaria exilis TaxID=1010633 RepID=A0A835BB60_9POAL|nr:hypothetical protein HU200_043505 [Digitaria exilis]
MPTAASFVWIMWRRIFFICSLSVPLVRLVESSWVLIGGTSLNHQIIFLRAREKFGSYIFREIIIIAIWALWVHRNIIIFMTPICPLLHGEDFLWRRSRRTP